MINRYAPLVTKRQDKDLRSRWSPNTYASSLATKIYLRALYVKSHGLHNRLRAAISGSSEGHATPTKY